VKIVIIGGVAAGMSAAAKAKRVVKDAKITIYEKSDIVSWGACGLPYYVGNFFENPENMIARPVQKFIEAGMDVRILHEVIEVDSVNKTVTVKDLATGAIFKDTYDKLMVATGAHPVLPPIKNLQLENVFTLKDYVDGITLKNALVKEEVKHITIIGAGYIGIEMVEAAIHQGKDVTLIQLDSRVLPESFDKEITDIMANELSSHPNVKLHLEETVLELTDKNGKVTGVKTNKGEYATDLVVIATGVRPSTNFVKNLGMDMLPNGAIIINQYGESSIKDIYSAGDCASVFHLVRKENVYIPLATTANKIGRTVGENFAENRVPFEGTLGSAAVKVLNLEAARTGISESEAIKMGINYKTVFIEDKNHTNYYPGQAPIFVKLIYNADTRAILGGQMIGQSGAVLRTDVIATAIYAKLTVDQLGMLDLCYAPPFARTWDVLNVAGNVAK
jgi:NADPH-dependent 2,4-dienoyl-CoA reductase/sulfur reductase-like enzyme